MFNIFENMVKSVHFFGGTRGTRSIVNVDFQFNSLSLDMKFVMFNTPMAWSDAQAQCRKIKGELASLHSPEEQSDAMKGAEDQIWYWIGLNDQIQENKWSWSDGSKIVWSNWRKNDPDGGRGQNCVLIYYDRKWIDAPCSLKKRFICKVASD